MLDETGFIELYDAVAPRAYGLALRVLGDPQEAEELTRGVLLELWTRDAGLDPTPGGGADQVLALVHRRAVDRARATNAAHDRDATLDTHVDTSAKPARADAGTCAVRAALDSLSPEEGRAVELAYFDGHTCAEVARLMQAPLATTAARIHTALLRLRGLLPPPATGIA